MSRKIGGLWLLCYLVAIFFPSPQLEAAPPAKHKTNTTLIVLDPGHGGSSIGARVGGIEEKALALKTAKKVQKILKKKGYRVVMTRTKDVFLSLEKRVKVANETKCKLFVSIHYNAHPNTTIHGIEVFYYNKGSKWRKTQSRKAAKQVLGELVTKTKERSRGAKHGNFHVIRETLMPAILIEAGFVTHPQSREQLARDAHLDSIAGAICKGIETYFGG